MPQTSTDFDVHNHGSIALLFPMTEAAHDWVAENLPEDIMTLGAGIAIEPRYLGDILEGIVNAGLSVQ